MQREQPLPLLSLLLGRLGCRRAHPLRQPGEVGLAGEEELKGVVLLQHVLLEGQVGQRELLVNLPQPRLAHGVQVGAAPHKVLVQLLEEGLLLGVELQPGFLLVFLVSL